MEWILHSDWRHTVDMVLIVNEYLTYPDLIMKATINCRLQLRQWQQRPMKLNVPSWLHKSGQPGDAPSSSSFETIAVIDLLLLFCIPDTEQHVPVAKLHLTCYQVWYFGPFEGSIPVINISSCKSNIANALKSTNPTLHLNNIRYRASTN